jgi:hypothetical protein
VTGAPFDGRGHSEHSKKTFRHIEVPAQQAGACGLREAPMLFAL